jgi:EAL domain-containing protein (putative c-di-GMP-specific phosphodiesterase class I)
MPVKDACNLGGGYLLSKPLPADGIVSLLQRKGVPR